MGKDSNTAFPCRQTDYISSNRPSPLAPSPITDPVTGELPRQLTKDEIAGLVKDLAKPQRVRRPQGSTQSKHTVPTDIFCANFCHHTQTGELMNTADT